MPNGGVGVGVTVAVGVVVAVAVGVGVCVVVGVGVGLGGRVAVGVAVAVAVGVGLGVPVGPKAHPPVGGPPEPLQRYSAKQLSLLCTPAVALALPLTDGAVDHVEPILSFIQPQLEIGRVSRIGEIDGAPFDIKDTVGGTTGNRGIDTAGAAREAGAAAV